MKKNKKMISLLLVLFLVVFNAFIIKMNSLANEKKNFFKQ